MNSKQIAIKYLAPKIEDPIDIFFNIEIFESILYWGRESAREFFATQPRKIFLVNYIDDVGPIVDEYLIHRREKMYQNALQKQNKLFNCLCSSEKVIAWLISRYINVFLSLVSNSRYRESINIMKIKVDFKDDIASYTSNLDEIIEFEKLKKLPKKQIVRALGKVWKEAEYTYRLEEFINLCQQFNFKNKEAVKIIKGDLVKLNLKKERTASGNFQLVLSFENP